MKTSPTNALRIRELMQLLLGILLGGIEEQIADTVGVAPFVIVPGNDLDKLLVKHDTSVGIEDARGVAADEVSGDDAVFGVLDDASKGSVGGLLHGGFDLIVGGLLLETDDEIDD